MQLLAAFITGLWLVLGTAAAGAQDAGALVGAWRGEVPDPVRGTAIIELLLRADGTYMRTYRPTQYFGMVHDEGQWAASEGLLTLAWVRYEVAPTPQFPPLQQGRESFVIAFGENTNVLLFRTPQCQVAACVGRLYRQG